MTTPDVKTSRTRSDKRRLQLVAGARVSRDEMDQIRAVADRDGLSVSNYIRGLVMQDLARA